MYIIYPSTEDNSIYPLNLLWNSQKYDALSHLIKLPNVNPNILDKYGCNLLHVISSYGFCCPKNMRFSIISTLLSHKNWHPDPETNKFLFGFLFNNYIDNNKYDCADILIKHQHIDVNQIYTVYGYTKNPLKGCLGHLLSLLLEKDPSESVMKLVRTLFSRNDVKIDRIHDPHPLMLPYVKFYTIKQQIIKQRLSRKTKLPKPQLWTNWQSIAYKLQTPPLCDNDMHQLREYAAVANIDPHLSAIAICVELSRNYDIYQQKLTYNHKLKTINDSDLYCNLFAEIPLEHIIVDDEGYGFNISEIDKIIGLKRHPYIGKTWDQITINHIPFRTYLEQHPINPLHLLHQMNSVSDEIIVSFDKHVTNRLMEYFSYLTCEICQIYMDNPSCRKHLLINMGITNNGNPSYSEFVEIVIAHLVAFPQETRSIIRQQIYREFELCQIYV